ncbi:4-hydroxy-tetrahydrodipicolinate synthase [Pseudohoeflea suaedae]|uniref:4-hydroxy-tetrahydrodipicolinate synthase n=1 Tax=Pseudohoeflea suaedae TaxID=877384 RepID=A0A4R5PJJ8_9HYPH|nr:4-hydroxy-tetrahydrodipicolinate synthase [Pseudohoeflea suaedae]TDH35843.1 4-hydroxy-tetrahydrodipicolinate synthase [Pseudohoeflea suaedae]
MFKGSIPALVTPFTQAGAVDEAAFAAHVDRVIKAGSHGVVPVGTTGESPTLSHAEHKRIVDLCVETVGGRVPVIAGAGSNNTVEAIDFARHAEKAGADAILVVTPYYNKPTQRGLHAHFSAIADSTSLPIVIYNIPGRSAVDMSVETMAALARDHKTIIGVKDATGNLARVADQRLASGPDFVQISGEDATAVGFNAMGGVGCISVTANVAPELCAQMQDATLAGDYARALELSDKLMPLHKAIFTEPGVCGTKYCLERLGLMTGTVRSPLIEVGPQTAALLDAAMAHAGLNI